MPRRGTTLPAFIEPMPATVVRELPEGDEWLYEVKWDGYLALLLKQDRHVQIRSRRNKDLSADYPTVRVGAERLRGHPL